MSTNRPDIGHLISKQEGSHQPPKRKLVWLLPVGLLLGFLLIFLLLFRDRLIPARSFDVLPAVGIAEKMESTQQARGELSGELQFQASGWVEPDPLPIKATALTSGIVEEVHVFEGELVKKGDLLATLIGIDTRLKRDAMAAKLSDVKASFEAHCVGTQLALQRMEVEKAHLAIAEANLEEASDKLQRYENLSSGSITRDEMLAVRLDRKRRQAEVAVAEARIEGIAQELNKISYEVLAIEARIQQAEISSQRCLKS